MLSCVEVKSMRNNMVLLLEFVKLKNVFPLGLVVTRRYRLKSAPYLRLKIFKEQLLETFGKFIFFQKKF